MSTIKQQILAAMAAAVIITSAVFTTPASAQSQAQQYRRVTEQVRKELVTLPWYGVFDNLAYQVEGGKVILSGQVVNPTTASDAAHRVARIEGVQQVVNHIEVLPLSPFDDDIRARTYRAVFNRGGLYRYAMGANPSLHIIVKNGNVTLEGVVANKMDSQLAYMAANQVPFVFSVTNHLQVERS